MKGNTFRNSILAILGALILGFIGLQAFVIIPQAQRAKEVTRAPNAHQARADQCLRYNDYPGAAIELREVVKEEPNNRLAMFELAIALRHAGQTQEAKRIYIKLAAEDDSWGRAAKRNLAKIEGP